MRERKGGDAAYLSIFGEKGFIVSCRSRMLGDCAPCPGGNAARTQQRATDSGPATRNGLQTLTDRDTLVSKLFPLENPLRRDPRDSKKRPVSRECAGDQTSTRLTAGHVLV